MSVLRNLESKIADLVEGTFGRVFRSEVRPVELARGLVKEMDQHKTVSVSRVYAPNEYVIWLSPEDRGKFEGSSTRSPTSSAPTCSSTRGARSSRSSAGRRDVRDRRALKLGEFGIQARLVRTSERSGQDHAEQGDHGHTMVYSTSDRMREELDQPRGPDPTGRAMVLAEGKRIVVSASGAVIGRSRDCDVTLSDPNVSRHHAEIRAGRPRRLGRGGPRLHERREGQRPPHQRGPRRWSRAPDRARDRRRPVRRGVAAPGCSIPSPSL